MKDYIAELAKRKKRQKIWTAVFVLGFMAVSLFFLMNATKINEQVFDQKIAVTEQKLEKGIDKRIVEAVHDSTKQLTQAIEIKDSIISEKEHYTEQMQQAVKSIEEERASAKALLDTLQRAQQKTDLIIKEINKLERDAGSVQTAQIKKVKSELQMVQAELKRAPVLVTKSVSANHVVRNKYSVEIIYMSNHRRQAKKVKSSLSNMRVPKFENLDKFSYNMSIRYFNDSDLSQAKKLKRKLDTLLNARFELRKLNLPAPDKTLEVWIGKKR